MNRINSDSPRGKRRLANTASTRRQLEFLMRLLLIALLFQRPHAMRRFSVCFVSLIVLCFSATAQSEPGDSDGYTLIAPISSSSAYLIDSQGRTVHQWRCSGEAGNATYLLADGSLLRTGRVNNPRFPARGGPGGLIQKLDWNSKVLWSYEVSSDKALAHHDVEPMPNGNVLVIAWDHHSKQEAVTAGRDPQTLEEDALWPESILELKPTGADGAEVVWRWNLWDHLIQEFDKTKANYGKVADHPERVDINFGVRRGGADWIHMNSVDYNAQLDQIVLSARWFNELWVIDHSTTTEQAASSTGGKSGKGGDLLYRWGNPYAYYGGFQFDRQLWAQHDVRWIDQGCPGAGNFLLFNNGDRRADRDYSSVDELPSIVKPDGSYELPQKSSFGPDTYTWSYDNPDDFYSDRISGAQRLPNGNTLICSGGQGWVFEVDPKGKIVWDFDLKDLDGDSGARAGLFRAPRYPSDFPGLKQLHTSHEEQ